MSSRDAATPVVQHMMHHADWEDCLLFSLVAPAREVTLIRSAKLQAGPNGVRCVSFDDFNDPVCPRIDQNSPSIDNRIAVVVSAVFRRHVVVSYTIPGQIRADPHIALVGI